VGHCRPALPRGAGIGPGHAKRAGPANGTGPDDALVGAGYLTSTVAPASASFSLTCSASSLVTPSLTG
jgi:hypothetical protein